jgi:hypothetical protein
MRFWRTISGLICWAILASPNVLAESATSTSNNIGSIIDNRGIITQGQVGNNTFNNFGPPPPTLTFTGKSSTQKNPDGTYTISYLANLSSAFVPTNVVVGVKKSDVAATGSPLNVVVSNGMMFMTQFGQNADFYLEKFQNPTMGDYQITVIVHDPNVRPTFVFAFNQP